VTDVVEDERAGKDGDAAFDARERFATLSV
jgi:hypothetical protein